MSPIVEAKVMTIYVASKDFDMYFCKIYFLKSFNRVKRLERRLNRDEYGGVLRHTLTSFSGKLLMCFAIKKGTQK